MERAIPLARRIAASRGLTVADVDDVAAEVSLRLLGRLRRVAAGDVPAVEDFDGYAAGITYHVLAEHHRRDGRELRLLRNRLHYLLTHDPRFALWSHDGVMVCGLTPWSGRAPVAPPLSEATGEMARADRPAAAVKAIFDACRTPIAFDVLLRLVASFWGIARTTAVPLPGELLQAAPTAAERLEDRDFLRALWREILELRQPQRAALLLNLRDEGGGNAAALFLLTGVAGLEAIAEAVGIPRLASLWNELPLDDNRIAAILGLTRQQVINLRMAARARLRRRMGRSMP